MRLLSTTRIKYFCAFVILTFASVLQAAESWPLKRDIDLSSGFGDYRPDRFHTGVDIRTGGVEGAPILSPVAGYVYRVKTSYIGYGKGLYVMGDDGYLYVYGHLSLYAPKIDKPLRAAQLKSERYYQDIYFPKDSIRIDKGEYLGKTGKTGTTAPHLHFEQRSGENFPLNPLAHGFALDDKVKPTFTRIGFKMTDDHSLFENGLRERFCAVKKVSDGVYRADSLLYFNRPFGVLADCYDQMRSGGMKQAVYKLTVLVDDKVFYSVTFDSLDFDIQPSVNLEYDYDSVVVNDDKRLRVLYSQPGNEYRMSRGTGNTRGIIGLDWINKPGRHEGKIIAEDCFGNRSELQFPFLWGPEENIFVLDSTVKVSAFVKEYYFTPAEGCKNLGIDSAKVYLNRGNLWGETPEATTELKPDGQLVCTVKAAGIDKAVLRLGLFAGTAFIQDNLFNGLQEHGKEIVALDHQFTDDGLLLILNVTAKQGAYARIALFDGDDSLGVVYPRYFTMLQYRAFIPPLKQYQHITKIGYAVTRDTLTRLKYCDTLNIYQVGDKDDEVVPLGDSATVKFRKDGFFSPRFVEVRQWGVRGRSQYKLNSDYYEIAPQAFVCKQDFCD